MSDQQLDLRLAAQVAHLSRIAVAGERLEEAAQRFTGVLEAFRVIQTLEPPEAGEAAQPLGRADLRADGPASSFGADRALANAPQSHRGHFRVPPVL